MWTFIHSSVRLLQPNKKKRWVNCKKKKKDILSKRKLTAVLCVFILSSSKLFCVCVRESTAKGQVRELKKKNNKIIRYIAYGVIVFIFYKISKMCDEIIFKIMYLLFVNAYAENIKIIHSPANIWNWGSHFLRNGVIFCLPPPSLV